MPDRPTDGSTPDLGVRQGEHQGENQDVHQGVHQSVHQGAHLGVHHGRAACIGQLRQALLALSPAASATPSAPVASQVVSPVVAPLASPVARTVWLVDPDFSAWPLDEPAVLAALTAWLRQGGRQLHLVGLHFEETARRLPRLARWRRDWTHAIPVHTPCDGHLPAALHGLLAPPLWLQWLDAADWRLRCSTSAALARSQQAVVADFLQRCEPAWPVTSLGL